MQSPPFLQRIESLCNIVHFGSKAPPRPRNGRCRHITCQHSAHHHSQYCGTHINYSTLKNLFHELLYTPFREVTEINRKIRIIACILHRYTNEIPRDDRWKLDHAIELMIHFRKWADIPTYRRPRHIVNNPYAMYNRVLRGPSLRTPTLTVLESIDDAECPICYDENTQLGKLPKCSHVMCQGCWDSWAKERPHAPTCPICRTKQK